MAGYSWPRRIAARVCAHPDFEMVVVLLIFGNMITLAMYRPTEPEHSQWNHALFWAGSWGCRSRSRSRSRSGGRGSRSGVKACELLSPHPNAFSSEP